MNTNSKMYKKVKREGKTELPLRFREETESRMYREIQSARLWKHMNEPYDPTSLLVHYYFGRANQRLVS